MKKSDIWRSADGKITVRLERVDATWQYTEDQCEHVDVLMAGQRLYLSGEDALAFLIAWELWIK